MHPELTKQLVQLQLEEARQAGLFGLAVQLEELGYPAFYVRFRALAGHERLLRFDYANYDTDPVDIEPVDLVTRELLPPGTWMRRGGGNFPEHGVTNRPFLCTTYLRSYFTHPGHDPLTTGQPWDQFRGDFRLMDVLRHIAGHFATGYWS